MANTDPQALKDAALAYERSNASQKDYDPSTQKAVDLQFAATQGGENTHPEEPITPTADVAVTADAKTANK